MSPCTCKLPVSGQETGCDPCPGQAVTAYATFPGTAVQVVAARRFVLGMLWPCPAGEDVIVMANELVTNAVVHSASGQGGVFRVAVTHRAADVRVEVVDQGGPWAPDTAADANTERGRGLLIVAGLARAWGITGDDSGRVAWFELGCQSGSSGQG